MRIKFAGSQIFEDRQNNIRCEFKPGNVPGYYKTKDHFTLDITINGKKVSNM